MIADPFVQTGVLALMGAIITRILLRKYPARRLIVQLVFFCALTALLLHHRIVPYEVAAERHAGLRAHLRRDGQDHLVDQRRLAADRLRPGVPDLRAPAARGPADPGPGRRRDLSRRRPVGRGLCLQRAGRHADRHLGRVRHHPGPGAAEHAGRRLLRHRAQPQQALRGRRLDRARATASKAGWSRPTGARPICSTPRTTSSCCPTACSPRRSSPTSAAPTAATA